MNDLKKQSAILNNKDLAFLFLRVGVGIIFIVAGWAKINGIEGTQNFFDGIGIPLPAIMAWVVAVVEFTGGLVLLVGYKIRIPSLLLAFIMLIAIVTVKIQGDSPFNDSRLDLMLMLSSLALTILGAGAYSLDRLLDK